jgi:hypothetical protein
MQKQLKPYCCQLSDDITLHLNLPTIRDNGFNTRLLFCMNSNLEWKIESKVVVPDAMPILFPFETVADDDEKKRLQTAGLVCQVRVDGNMVQYTPNPVYCLCLVKECLKLKLAERPVLLSYDPP